MNHEQLQSLLGAYALDAIDPDEAALLEAHLAECPHCRSEVSAHLETAALLGNFGGDAPAGIWDRISAELAGDDERASAEPPMPAGVIPLRARRPLTLPVLAAITSAAAVLVGLLGVTTVRLQHRVNKLQGTVAAAGLRQAASSAVLDPHHSSVRLASADGRLTADVVIERDGQAYLVGSDLPALTQARTYQLWGLEGGRVVSLGLLGTDAQLAAFRIDPSTSQLMVTSEPQGGLPQPDGPPIIQGAV